MKNILARLNIRFDRFEISGSLGDLGVFLPLAAGMATRCGMNLGYILFFAGIMNVASGLIFGIPVAVQPMKVIAAVAIADGLGAESVAAAGLLAGGIILLFGVTGLIEKLGGLIPKAIVRGLQLTIGIKLVLKGLEMAAGTGIWLAPDSVITAILCAAFILLFIKSKSIPVALIVFATGVLIVFFGNTRIFNELRLGSDLPGFIALAYNDLRVGFMKGTIPQIPLTLLNSVIAVCALSSDLFPKKPLQPGKVAVSVGIMNLIACPLGGMPMCHGAGGLAAQYRFGSRTGGSVVFLGMAKVALAVLFGSSLFPIVRIYPASILGVLLVFAGWQMAVVRGVREIRQLVLMLFTAAACLTAGVAAGFLIAFSGFLIIKRYWPEQWTIPSKGESKTTALLIDERR